jgi:hypothetical protein
MSNFPKIPFSFSPGATPRLTVFYSPAAGLVIAGLSPPCDPAYRQLNPLLNGWARIGKSHEKGHLAGI